MPVGSKAAKGELEPWTAWQLLQRMKFYLFTATFPVSFSSCWSIAHRWQNPENTLSSLSMCITRRALMGYFSPIGTWGSASCKTSPGTDQGRGRWNTSQRVVSAPSERLHHVRYHEVPPTLVSLVSTLTHNWKVVLKYRSIWQPH